MISSDELVHLIKQLVTQQTNDYRTSVYGHIASYDNSLHRVTVLFPSLRDENGVPALSPWMPLSSAWVGNGFGLQIAPHGGATADNPTAGEACIVELIERGRGISLCASLRFTNEQLPPSTTQVTPLAAGEALLSHESGSFLRFYSDGGIFMHAAKWWAQDVNGYGSKTTWTGGNNWHVDNYTIGAIVTSTDHNISPPAIPVT